MIDVNLKGVLYGIAAALPVFRRQSFGHFVNVISTAGIQIIPTMAVYAGTKNAVRTITETLRQEAGDNLRVNMSKLLEGKVTVITGGGQGVGLGIAQEFVEQGASVIVTGRRQATLDEAIAMLGPKSSGIEVAVDEARLSRCI